MGTPKPQSQIEYDEHNLTNNTKKVNVYDDVGAIITHTNPFPIEIISAESLADGSKTVSTAGTREALAASTTIKNVIIHANVDNLGTVYVGGATVSKTSGFPLLPGQHVDVHADNLAEVYLDVDYSGEGVTFVYFS